MRNKDIKVIRRVFLDAKQHLWVCASYGVWRSRNPIQSGPLQLEKVDTGTKGQNETFFDGAVDQQGSVWLAGSNGLVVHNGSTYKRYTKKDIAWAIFTGFIGAYLCYILLYFGYASASGLEVLILQYSWPLMMVLISIFYLKEKQNLRRCCPRALRIYLGRGASREG